VGVIVRQPVTLSKTIEAHSPLPPGEAYGVSDCRSRRPQEDAGFGYGVYGISDGYGVYGSSPHGYGVYGSSMVPTPLAMRAFSMAMCTSEASA
jgi:hypothetical protein